MLVNRRGCGYMYGAEEHQNTAVIALKAVIIKAIDIVLTLGVIIIEPLQAPLVFSIGKLAFNDVLIKKIL